MSLEIIKFEPAYMIFFDYYIDKQWTPPNIQSVMITYSIVYLGMHVLTEIQFSHVLTV